MKLLFLTSAFTIFVAPAFAQPADPEKICAAVDAVKNPNRAVICEIWKMQKASTSRTRTVVKIEDPDLFRVSCGSGNDPCSKDQALKQCERRGFVGVQYFTTTTPSGSSPSRHARFTALYCHM